MTDKFNKIINEYIVGTQNTTPVTTMSFALPPDTETGLGQSKKHRKALIRDKKLKRKYEKPI